MDVESDVLYELILTVLFWLTDKENYWLAKLILRCIRSVRKLLNSDLATQWCSYLFPQFIRLVNHCDSLYVELYRLACKASGPKETLNKISGSPVIRRVKCTPTTTALIMQVAVAWKSCPKWWTLIVWNENLIMTEYDRVCTLKTWTLIEHKDDRGRRCANKDMQETWKRYLTLKSLGKGNSIQRTSTEISTSNAQWKNMGLML